MDYIAINNFSPTFIHLPSLSLQAILWVENGLNLIVHLLPKGPINVNLTDNFR